MQASHYYSSADRHSLLASANGKVFATNRKVLIPASLETNITIHDGIPGPNGQYIYDPYNLVSLDGSKPPEMLHRIGGTIVPAHHGNWFVSPLPESSSPTRSGARRHLAIVNLDDMQVVSEVDYFDDEREREFAKQHPLSMSKRMHLIPNDNLLVLVGRQRLIVFELQLTPDSTPPAS